MRLTIPDDLADRYLQELPTGSTNSQRAADPAAGPKYTLEDALVRVLTRAVPLMHEGAVVLTKQECQLLADRLQVPQAATPTLILDAAANLCDLKIGKHKFALPPAVLKGLKDRADREGKPFGEYVQMAIEKLSEELAVYA